MKDDGRGQSPQVQAGSGTELVDAFAEQIGGTVSRESTPGAGTTVTTAFPLRRG